MPFKDDNISVNENIDFNEKAIDDDINSLDRENNENDNIMNSKMEVSEKTIDIISMEEKILNIGKKKDDIIDDIISDPLHMLDEKGKKKDKTKKQLQDEIKIVEDKLNIRNAPITRLSKPDLEKYLVELIGKLGQKIQENNITKTEQVNESITDDPRVRIQNEIKKQNNELKAKIETSQDNGNMAVTEGAEFLYRANFMLFYLMERVSVLTEDRVKTNLVGIVDKLEEDKNKILLPIYYKLFREHKAIIQEYGSPLMELAFYAISTMGSVAGENFKKKQNKI